MGEKKPTGIISTYKNIRLNFVVTSGLIPGLEYECYVLLVVHFLGGMVSTILYWKARIKSYIIAEFHCV